MLTWWGHAAHDEVDDEIVDRVHEAVLGGMGLIVLHSGHYSKIFKRLLGTTCSLQWRNAGERELVWTVDPAHPIADGIPQPIVIEAQEMYGEHFDIPAPDELVFISSFAGGEVFRGGCCFRRGRGRIFYFSPGDQDYPVYHHPDVQRVIANAVRWAARRRAPMTPLRVVVAGPALSVRSGLVRSARPSASPHEDADGDARGPRRRGEREEVAHGPGVVAIRAAESRRRGRRTRTRARPGRRTAGRRACRWRDGPGGCGALRSGARGGARRP